MLISAGKEKASLAATIVGAISNFSLNLIFIPRYGAAGAAIGTVCAEFLVTATQFILGRKIVDWKNLFRTVVQVFAAVFVMVLSILFFMKIVNNKVTLVLLSIGIGSFLYGSLLFLFRNEFAISMFRMIKGSVACRK